MAESIPPAPRLGGRLRLGLRLRLGFWLGFVHHRSPYRITLRRRPRRRGRRRADCQIEAQRCKLEALATLNDYQLIDVVVDAGASAKSLDRPGWQRVMDAVHGRQVGAVLIAKLDRCTRSVADLASLIDTFSRRGVALISAAESLDTSSAGGRLVVNVLGAVAQWEREATAERTSAALQVLKQQGRATGGVAPYGFQFIDGRRAWHQGEQETLAAIIEHRRAGLSWAKVVDKLNATGHRTRTGGQWTRPGAHQVHRARERDDQAAA